MYRHILLQLVATSLLASSAYGDTCTNNVANSLKIGGATQVGCICPSGFAPTGAEGACEADAVCAAADLAITTNSVSTDNMGYTVTNGLTTLNANTDIIEMTLRIPAATGRYYTGIGVYPPGSANAGFNRPATGCNMDLFQSLVNTVPVQTVCYDQWVLKASFQALRDCGFLVSGQELVSDNYQIYDGIIRVAFTEPIRIGDATYGADVNRAASIDFPFRIQFESQETVALTADVKVFSNFLIDFGISEQNIPRKSTVNSVVDKPYIRFQYRVQWPYDIIAWTLGTQPAIPAAFSTSPLTDTAGNGAAPTSACVSPTNYQETDAAGATATCNKNDNYLVFTPAYDSAAQCSFAAYAYTINFSVKCGSGVLDADCPLQTPDATSNSVTFTLTSENFCENLALSQNIDDVVALTGLKPVSLADYDNTFNAFRLDDYQFYKLSYTTKIILNQFKLTGLWRAFALGDAALSFETNPDWSSADSNTDLEISNVLYSTSSSSVGGLVASSATNQGDVVNAASNDVTMGWVKNNDVYRFALRLNSAFFTEANYNTVVRGAMARFRIKVRVDVTYDDPSARRRRRRQVTTQGGAGAIESPESTVTTAPQMAEAAPNAGSRAMPVLALAAALLSAVMAM